MDGNLLKFLLEQFYNTPQDQNGAKDWAAGEEPPTADHFVEFAQAYLQKNPPVGTAVIDIGLAIRLQDGRVLGFLPQKPKPTKPEIRGVFITNPGINPVNHGISDISCVHVTDPNRDQ